MVQEYTSPVRVYEYPFEMVMEAYQKRFPTCEMIPAFLGSDITHEYNSEDGAIHIIERRCRLHADAPYLLRKMAGIDHVIFMQRNSLNRRDRTLKIEAWNESFDTRLKINEFCYYSVHPENSKWTLFEQDAKLDIISFYGFEALVEKVAIKAYTVNLKKGKEIIMYYIKQLIAEGRTEFVPFEGSEGRPRSRTHPDNLAIKEKSTEENDAGTETEKVNPPETTETKIPTPPIQDAEQQDEVEQIAQEVEGVNLTSNPNSSEQLTKVVEPPPVQEYKLDDHYIARYLGDLTTKEEASLMQLRKRFQAMHLGKPPSEFVLLRFLRARDANVDKALEMLKNSLHWRRLHHVDTILETWNPSENILEYYPGGWHHYDKDGRPVYIVRLGSMDVKGLLKTVGEDGFVKQVVSINEEGLLKCAGAADIFKKPITNWTLIVDLDKLNMRHLWRPGTFILKCYSNNHTFVPITLLVLFFIAYIVISHGLLSSTSILQKPVEAGELRLCTGKHLHTFRKLRCHPTDSCSLDRVVTEKLGYHRWKWSGIRALLKIIEIVEANYPETMGQLLIVRAPKVFGVVWTLLSPFIDENTRKKFMIYTGDDYQGPGGLVDYIPKEYIPTFLGGPCECNVSEGKPVPKTLYKFDHVGEATESTWLDTDLYQTAYIMKGTPHYVSFSVSEAEAVLTWDFDVIEGDCLFQVLRHKRPREASSQNITCLGEATGNQRLSIRPGIDAQVVEKPITCYQGDSLQGTHICQQPGLYLLEWKYSNPVTVRQSLKFHNKTKVMYYHELLPSRDFRGSMSSMCSSQSGFSQLSSATHDLNTSVNTSTASQSSNSTY